MGTKRLVLEARQLVAHARRLLEFEVARVFQHLLLQAVRRFNLSARAYDKIIRVARTIADLEGAAGISTAHISEAVQYRAFDPTGDPAGTR